MINEKPELPTHEEALQHYGVLGMKWGHRRRANSDQIHNARIAVGKQKTQIQKQHDKVNALRPGTAGRATEAKRLSNLETSALKNPDRVIAARMTKGEKAASVLFSILLFPPALPVAAVGIAGTSARSRTIERRQDQGAYDKKK